MSNIPLRSSPIFTRASVPAGEPVATAAQLRADLGAGPHALVLAFAASTIDRPGFAAAAQAAFPGVPVVGCTTAGEIGATGFAQGTVAAAALAAGEFHAAHVVFPDLRAIGFAEVRQRVAQGLHELRRQGVEPSADTTFAMLLVDGLSVAEEVLASRLAGALGEIALVGGSAGDGVAFGHTHVFVDGLALEHAAVLVLVHTNQPFEVFKTQHFVPGRQRLVVTAADCSRRIVRELDGEPAATEFARLHGIAPQRLGPVEFATHPVVVCAGGAEYVRSIQKVDADGSLTFFCAIEEGVVLRDAQGVDLADSLRRTVAQLTTNVGAPRLLIAFDCVLRGLECQRTGIVDEVGAILRAANAVGFSTYGEQFRGMHVNQTLTGVVIGSAR